MEVSLIFYGLKLDLCSADQESELQHFETGLSEMSNTTFSKTHWLECADLYLNTSNMIPEIASIKRDQRTVYTSQRDVRQIDQL